MLKKLKNVRILFLNNPPKVSPKIYPPINWSSKVDHKFIEIDHEIEVDHNCLI